VGVVESPRAAGCLVVRGRVFAGVLVPVVATGMTRPGYIGVVVRRVFVGVLVLGVAMAMTHPAGVHHVVRRRVLAGVPVPVMSVGRKKYMLALPRETYASPVRIS
jgi:hypothetical protein